MPTPASLTIAPSAVTITTGTTVAFLATDDLARPRYDATWTVSDPSKASLTVTANGASLTGLTLGQVTLTADIDGVQAQASVTIAPESLRITPARATLLAGHQRQFSVVDEKGRPSPLAAWTLSDETLAGITSDSSPVLTALLPGQVTLTATVLGVTMTAEVTILEGTTYPQGTVLWTAPVTPGFVPTGIVQTVMFDPDNTATYTVQQSTGNPESLVQAFTKDGRQVWERRLRPLLGEPVSDGAGGLLVTEACDSENPVQLSALDQTTGAIKWYTQIAPQVRRDRVPRTRRGLPSVAMAPWRSRRRPTRCPASWSSANGAGGLFSRGFRSRRSSTCSEARFTCRRRWARRSWMATA